ncbi:MAG: hypothetical protein FWG55_05130 [Candidatus Bathyarchaeota archaeon]|nr:hypothetical protein [Candidatus Termiticorpusculum sp.]
MLNKKVRLLLIFACVMAIIIPTQISIVNSSAGMIRINRTTASALNQQVTAGDNVNLYFGDPSITWSGSQFYLFLSRDLSTTASSGDYVYSPAFSVANLQSPYSTPYSNNDGSWVIGSNWVNGTFASNMTAGRYSVKAFDFGAAGSVTDTGTVAVTDTFITVNTPQTDQFNFQITPNEGPGGIPVKFSGSGYPAFSTIDIAYYDPTYSEYRAWRKETTDASGSFSFTAEMPDLGKSNYQGDNPETFNRVQFKTQCQGLTYSFATYNQYARGLKTIGDQTAYGLYGNNSNLISTVKVKAGDTFTITGKWFHPGAIYVLLDSKATVGTVTHSQWNDAIRIGSAIANNLGNFEAKVTIPDSTDGGEHYIAIEDSDDTLIVKILVTSGSLQISPSSGPGGAKIQFTGSGYPPSSSVDINYRDNLYSSWNYWTTIRADTAGNINLSVEIPDLKNSCYSGDSYETYTQISFMSEVNGRAFAFADYTQYARGLKQVGSKTASALYGSSTNFANYDLKVKSGDSITISGRYFHPGVIYVRWDGEAVVGTVTADQWRNASIIGTSVANAQGSFEVTITIPTSDNGNHWVSIEDSQTNFIIQLPVSDSAAPQPTPTPNPDKPTPVINFQGKSTPIDNGFRVDISGILSNNNVGLADKAIQVYNSKDGGRTWETLTIVNTDNEGKFSVSWVSSSSGIFLFKAECAADIEYNWAITTVNVAIEPASESNSKENVFTMTSNSTISQLSFNSETSELSFKASGETGTTGYVSVNMPKTLINNISNLKVYLDGNELTFSSSQESDTWTITITYTHSTHTIVMNLAKDSQNQNNPQLPTEIIIVASIIGAILIAAAIVTTRKKKHHNQT